MKKNQTRNKYTIFCDGGKKNYLSYGSFKIFDQKNNVITHRFMIFGFGTSNTAEYLAFINAIKYCNMNKIREADFKLDSLLVVNQVFGRCKTHSGHLKKLRGVARTELGRMKSYTLEKISRKEIKRILGH